LQVASGQLQAASGELPTLSSNPKMHCIAQWLEAYSIAVNFKFVENIQKSLAIFGLTI